MVLPLFILLNNHYIHAKLLIQVAAKEYVNNT